MPPNTRPAAERSSNCPRCPRPMCPGRCPLPRRTCGIRRKRPSTSSASRRTRRCGGGGGAGRRRRPAAAGRAAAVGPALLQPDKFLCSRPLPTLQPTARRRRKPRLPTSRQTQPCPATLRPSCTARCTTPTPSPPAPRSSCPTSSPPPAPTSPLQCRSATSAGCWARRSG